MRNPQTQTILGWKPSAAKAYRNILVFYKPLAPSTRAGRLIRPEGLADLLLTTWGSASLSAQLLSVQRQLGISPGRDILGSECSSPNTQLKNPNHGQACV